jgi:hypothetical protein
VVLVHGVSFCRLFGWITSNRDGCVVEAASEGLVTLDGRSDVDRTGEVLPNSQPSASSSPVRPARDALGLDCSSYHYGDDDKKGPMGTISVYFENGFENDRVTVSAAGEEREEANVTTRYQIGLASVVKLTVPDGVPSALQVTLPDRGLAAETTVDPKVTPHVRVNATDGSLVVRPEADPPMFA